MENILTVFNIAIFRSSKYIRFGKKVALENEGNIAF